MGVQTHDGRGKNHQAYLWQYSRPGGSVVFDFRMGREREGPKRFLGNFEGILQSDGYGAYDHVGGKQIVYAACWGMPGESSSMQCNLMLTIKPRFGSWRR